MCGICGIHNYGGGPAPAHEEMTQIRDYMAARGPDASGHWQSSDGHTLLGHRRLSIIDLQAASNQPMDDGYGHEIVFNGEIYNYRDLRENLITKGHSFKTQGDTEVLLALYREYGADMLPMLRGMFAFAIYDANTRHLFAARDSFGIKPFYYMDNDRQLYFASSVKALTQIDASFTVDDRAIAGFLSFGSVPEPFTIYEEIKALGAGEMLTVTPEQGVQIKPWYSLAKTLVNPPVNEGALSDAEIRDALCESLKYHMVADTPVGLFLSAGLDSTTMLALLTDLGFKQIHTITVKFEEFEGNHDDESVLAAEAARYYGANHTEYLVTWEVFDSDFSEFMQAMDQPTIDGLNTWFVAKAAKKNGLKVCLSGLGADELLGGYPSYNDIPKWSRLGLLGPARIRQPMMAMVAGLCEKAGIDLHPKIPGLLGLCDSPSGAYQLKRGLFMPWEVEHIMGRKRGRAALKALAIKKRIGRAMEPHLKSDFGRVILMETAFYMRNQLLRDADWASMAHSLELRVPFVDKVLFEALAPRLSAHHSPGKSVLTRIPEGGLMLALVNRAKTGFTVPIADWTDSRISGLEEKYGKAHVRGHWSRRWALEVIKRASYNA